VSAMKQAASFTVSSGDLVTVGTRRLLMTTETLDELSEYLAVWRSSLAKAERRAKPSRATAIESIQQIVGNATGGG
jgi:hypothetical protein